MDSIDVLYKYRLVNENSIKALEMGRLWYSTPGNLNDPNDIKTTWEVNFTAKEIIENYVTKRSGGKGGEFKDDDFRGKLNDLIEKMKKDGYGYKKILHKIDEIFMPVDKKTQKEMLQDVLYYNRVMLANCGILSLSENPINPLMWAHYSDSHRGFCLGFEIHDTNVLGQYSNKVNYIDNYTLPALVSLAMDADQNDFLNTVAFTKSRDWEYEKEWRVLKAKGDMLYPYPGKLTEIILGLNISDENEAIIKEAIFKSGYIPHYKRVCKAIDSYKYEIIDC